MRFLVFVVLGLVASCVRPDAVTCADGSVCPRDRTCFLVGDGYQCVTDEQLAACEGLPDLTLCPGGTCFGGACLAPSCGDGRVSPIEVCDDANTTSGDGCSSDCRSDEKCGNGIVDLQTGEQCDDGPLLGALSHDGCSSGCLDERPEWRLLLDYDELVTLGVVTYDAARGRVIVVADSRGQIQTAEIEAGMWHHLTPLVSPALRTDFAIAYDAHRRRVVLFGGIGFNDTWEWDGATWRLMQPVSSPPGRADAVMAYDPIARHVVMFGGRSSTAGTNSELDDTWFWDGTTWTRLDGPGPSRRTDAAMTFDPVRGVMVLYGGSFSAAPRSDTWELSGTTWTERTPSTNAGARRRHAMAFDPVSSRVLLYGGAALASTYAWDGANWTMVANDLVEAGRSRLVTVTHERRVLKLGPFGVHEWNGAGWTLVLSPLLGSMDASRVASAVDVDGRRALVFGGERGARLDRTSLWRGVWMLLAPATPPPGRARSAMAYDASRNEFVMFGGEGQVATLADTWVFDASGEWVQRTPTTSPSARSGHTMVYDATRGVVVLFGGQGESAIVGDTWIWDGTTWNESVGPSPPPRTEHAAIYDPIRAETILFGGLAGVGKPALGDTWRWNGAWSKVSDLGPSPRFATALAWDAHRRRIVVFGGDNGANQLNDAWEWDGSSWTQVASTTIAKRAGHALVQSPDGAGVIRFGLDNAMERDPVALLRWSSATPQEACVVDEDFDGDSRDESICGGDDPDCWRICTPACPPETSCSVAGGCGDSVCKDGRESCLSCPQDCGACPATCGDLVCTGGESNASCAADCP